MKPFGKLFGSVSFFVPWWHYDYSEEELNRDLEAARGAAERKPSPVIVVADSSPLRHLAAIQDVGIEGVLRQPLFSPRHTPPPRISESLRPA
jgi:hypothetical protein